MDSEYSGLAARIKALRESRGLTQADVAKLRNITQSAVAKQEMGDRALGDEGLVWYARYFNVTTDYLLGLTNDSQFEQPATIAARPTAGMPPISEDRLNEIIAQAVKTIRAEAAKTEKKPGD